MTEERISDASHARLSEDAAHRLLARAIELDHSRGSETTVADLRDAAFEAGISTRAFDLAVRELGSPSYAQSVDSGNLISRFWHRMRATRVDARRLIDAVESNIIAATLFWGLTAILSLGGREFGLRGMEVSILLGCVLGVSIARRLRARVVEIGLIGMIAFQASELSMHLLYGNQAVQGGPTHFAVMIAGVLGAGIAWSVGRGRRERGDVVDEVDITPLKPTVDVRRWETISQSTPI